MLWETFFLHDGGQTFRQLKYYANDGGTRTEAENPIYSRATRLTLAYFNVSVRFLSRYSSYTLTMTTSAACNPGYVLLYERKFLSSQ